MPDFPGKIEASPDAANRPHLTRLVLGQLTGVRGPAPGIVDERRQSDDERRRHSLRSFLHGGFRPRRRAGRRSDDHHRIFLDWHEPRLLYLALAVLLMSCADALFTLNILAGGGRELNGIMDQLIASDIRHFLAIKIGLTAISLVLLVMLANRRFLGRFPVVRVLQLFCCGYLLLMGYEIVLLSQITEIELSDAPSLIADFF